MIDYILLEKNPSPFLKNGITLRVQATPYAVSLDRLGFKSFSIEPMLRVETIPKLDGSYDVQHHGIASRKRSVRGNIRLDGLSGVDNGISFRSLREYIAELEILKLDWLANNGILCTLLKLEDGRSTLEISECYISRGIRVQMSSSIAGEPLLRTWSFELTELYQELDEVNIFDGSFLPLPGSLTDLTDLGPEVILAQPLQASEEDAV